VGTQSRHVKRLIAIQRVGVDGETDEDRETYEFDITMKGLSHEELKSKFEGLKVLLRVTCSEDEK